MNLSSMNRSKLMGHILTLAVLSTLVMSFLQAPFQHTKANPGKVLLGYFFYRNPDGTIATKAQAAALPANKFTEINFAFFNPSNSSGAAGCSEDPGSNTG